NTSDHSAAARNTGKDWDPGIFCRSTTCSRDHPRPFAGNVTLVDIHAVAALMLGAIERRVRPSNEGIDLRDRVIAGTGADTDGGADCMVANFDACGFETGTNAFGDLARAFPAARNDRYELLAAKSADDVICARARAHDLTEQAENIVACSMAEAVIDRFEMVEIEHQRRHWFTPFALLLAQCECVFHERAAIEQAGERIGRCGRTID